MILFWGTYSGVWGKYSGVWGKYSGICGKYSGVWGPGFTWLVWDTQEMWEI